MKKMYKGNEILVVETGIQLSKIQEKRGGDWGEEVWVKTSEIYDSVDFLPKMIYREGKPYKEESEVTKEIIDFVLSESQEWTSVDKLVNRVSQRFSQYTREDGSPLNQGGFDPMFCITVKNPGKLIKSGLLIFRKAPKYSGYQNEFKSRISSSQDEIQQSQSESQARGKFVFDTSQEIQECKLQSTQSLNV